MHNQLKETSSTTNLKILFMNKLKETAGAYYFVGLKNIYRGALARHSYQVQAVLPPSLRND